MEKEIEALEKKKTILGASLLFHPTRNQYVNGCIRLNTNQME
jgi:hypothetical protein